MEDLHSRMEVEYRLALFSLGRERSRLEETVRDLQADIQDEREQHAERWEIEAFSGGYSQSLVSVHSTVVVVSIRQMVDTPS